MKLEKVVTILSTDLSIDRDPDDWFDLFLFLKLEELNPGGIILDHYATEEVENETRKFLRLVGSENIPVNKGVQSKLAFNDEDRLVASQFQDGADFILETMREAKGKVRIISVGSLRNEAYAFKMDSTLFMGKIDKLYFAAGNWENLKEANINRDLKASEIVINSPIPKVWIPCTQEIKLFLSGELEQELYEKNDSISKFLGDKLKRWREYRPGNFLKRTGQYPFGKNLWSFPAFYHASNLLLSEMSFEKGKIKMNLSDERIYLDKKDEGEDLMLQERNHDAMVRLFWELLNIKPESK